MESRDIQIELAKVVEGMSPRDAYSQLCYFLISIATAEDNHRTHGVEIATIIGLLSDSYYGRLAMNKFSAFKEE